jgi:hypothetical protein
VVGLIATVLTTGAGFAQQTPPVQRGTWSATVGSRVISGVWSAQTLPAKPDSAIGSWAVLTDRGVTLFEGTWSATKQTGKWRGSWSARMKTSRASAPAWSGTWEAALTEGAGTESFKVMLQRSLQHEITGAWKSGTRSGGWRIRSR